MKLISIRLHPFGGTADRKCTLHDGINVLEGPNEFGKSTLSNALWHALFTPTNLPRVRLQNTIGRWYPKPGGDHARITVQFQAVGETWTLQKTWGAGAASHLRSDSSAGIADPAEVQAKLCTLLQRSEATWQHVLFTSQAQLAATMEQLRVNAGEVDDVQPLLAGPAAIPGDIPPDRLSAAVEDRINQHFGRWDRATQRPEGGRGIDNPWKNGIGTLLTTWYAQATVRRTLQNVIQHENDVDGVNTQIHHVAEEMSGDDEFVRNGRSIRDGLGQRAGLDERCKRLTSELRVLREIMTAWPGAAQVIEAKVSELNGVIANLESVETELRNARRRSQSEQLKRTHDLLTKAREAWKFAANLLAQSTSVAPEQLTELKRLEREIDSSRIQIAAQKLMVKLESTASRSVTVQRGTGEQEVVSLSPSATWESQSEGIFRLEYQDLKLSVESGTGDMNGLFTALETASSQRTDILKSLGHESLAAAQLANDNHQKLATDESKKEALYRAALQGRTEEEWTTDMTALAELPETRSVEFLEGENSRLLERKAGLDGAIRLERERIETWKRDHLDLDSLTDKIVDKNAETKTAQRDLVGLPELPEGFAAIPDYLALLGQKETNREKQEERLRDLKIEQGRLRGAAPATTSEELRTDLEITEREFERQQAHGQALLRIKERLQSVITGRGIDDPMQGLTTAVSEHFRHLTEGRYQEVTLAGTAPAQVVGTLTLDTNVLSQGTLGSLALATRLALSELYLKGMDGFFLLDDPFTDMDATRRAAAIQAIGTFAKKHQVLFLTCHKEHAQELQVLVGAKGISTA
jgi:exonuclease SbcC